MELDQAQAAARDAIAFSTNHVNVIARAGTGKSTVILAALEQVPGHKTCLLSAFNKDVQAELARRAPSYVRVKTYHSLGLLALGRRYRNVQVDASKGRRIARTVAREAERNTRRVPGSDLADQLYTATKLAKNMLVRSLDEVERLIVAFGIDDATTPAARLAPLVAESLRRASAEPSVVDYDDMIYLPTKLQVPIPASDYVIIDEAQDLGPAQVHLMRSACRDRFIAVGDPRQAIHFFRGADPAVMDQIATDLQSQVMQLSRSYRCSEAVADFVRREIPGLADFEAAPDAAPGEVVRMGMDEFLGPFGPRPGDFVLSRTNAPLMPLCTHFLRRGIPATVAGREVGQALLHLIDRAAQPSVRALLAWLDDYADDEVARITKATGDVEVAASRVQRVHDEVQAIRAIATGLSDVSVVRELIQKMFSDATPTSAIVLSTVHRAKGLERDTVWLLEDTFFTGQNHVEEENIFYVAATRAQRRLVLVDKRG